MDPSAGAPGFEGVKGGLVQAVLLIHPALTPKMKLGMLPTLPLFNGALDGQGQFH